MNRHIFHSLSQAQCIQITALHALCTPEKKAPEQEPSVLCLELPDPDSSEEDVFYGLYYIEETLVSFLSFFCPDGKTAEISGFTHPDYQNRGYFSLLLEEARAEALSCFGPVSLIYQCLSWHPGTQALIQAEKLCFSHAECLLTKTISHRKQDSCPSPSLPPVRLESAGESSRSLLIHLHEEAFGSGPEFAESYMDTNLQDPATESFLICSPGGTAAGLLHITTDESSRVFYLMGFGILSEFRRKGYARAALRALYGRLASGSRLLLQVSTENFPAFRLYESEGFQIHSRLDYFSSPSSASVNASFSVPPKE